MLTNVRCCDFPYPSLSIRVSHHFLPASLTLTEFWPAATASALLQLRHLWRKARREVGINDVWTLWISKCLEKRKMREERWERPVYHVVHEKDSNDPSLRRDTGIIHSSLVKQMMRNTKYGADFHSFQGVKRLVSMKGRNKDERTPKMRPSTSISLCILTTRFCPGAN